MSILRAVGTLVVLFTNERGTRFGQRSMTRNLSPTHERHTADSRLI
jgi:hypothetical protein